MDHETIDHSETGLMEWWIDGLVFSVAARLAGSGPQWQMAKWQPRNFRGYGRRDPSCAEAVEAFEPHFTGTRNLEFHAHCLDNGHWHLAASGYPRSAPGSSLA